MRELIVVLRDLVQKVKEGTATALDWLSAARAVIDVIIESQVGFGSPDVEAEEEIRAVAAELIEESTGEPAGGMQAGPLVSIFLPMLIKFLLQRAFSDGDGNEDQS